MYDGGIELLAVRGSTYETMGARPRSDSKIFFSLARVGKSCSLFLLSELFRDSVTLVCIGPPIASTHVYNGSA